MIHFFISLHCTLLYALLKWRNHRITRMIAQREYLAHAIIKACNARKQTEITWKTQEAHRLAFKIEHSQRLKIQRFKSKRLKRCATSLAIT